MDKDTMKHYSAAYSHYPLEKSDWVGIACAVLALVLIIGWIVTAGLSDIRNHACVDRGGAPVEFKLYTKGAGSGFRCIADYRIVEVK